jgi:hypothetical protein
MSHADQPLNFHHRYPVEHALPFATIFHELQTMRGDAGALVEDVKLSKVIGDYIPGTGDPFARLEEQITKSRNAYEALERKKRGRGYHVEEDATCAEVDKPLLEILHHIPRTALCLSGGGIRSASYGLGILQALAEFNDTDDKQRCADGSAPSALEQFDYLSTVSGGGYIGSWLMAWTWRVARLGSSTRPDNAKQAFRQIAAELAGCKPHTSGDPAPRALRHLREYTSFLAPAVGLTLDVWTLAALVLRNLVVNWVMILPLVLALVAGLQSLHYGLITLACEFDKVPPAVAWWAIGALFGFAGVMAGYRMPTTGIDETSKHRLGAGFVFGVFILPLLLGSVLVVEVWWTTGGTWQQNPWPVAWPMAVSAFVTFVSVPIIRSLLSKKGRKVVREEHSLPTYLAAGVAAAAVTATLLAASLLFIGKHAIAVRPANACLLPDSAAANGFALYAFPALWILLITASALFSGFLGTFEEDVDREWWARAGALMLSTLAAWLVAESLVIYAPSLLNSLHQFAVAKIASIGILSGFAGALGGASTAGGVGASSVKNADVSKLGKFLNRFGLLVPTLCALALLILGALTVLLEGKIVSAWGHPSNAAGTHALVCVTAAVVGLLANWAININIFSLHGMYRMRLIRAFLGASNTRRTPNSFTGFDDDDNVFETEIPTGRGVPLHIVNATVNLVGTKKLAWRQRKAESFTFSPLHCGGWRLGYVETARYGRHGQRGSSGGLSLGTAMAISGAAFNPNMGYHSSPLVTLLMTLFNLRLGWWLPNPSYKRSKLHEFVCRRMKMTMTAFWEKKSPRLALRPLLQEALGGTDDRSAYIELTDGGHFENLGLYEMVLRRTKMIVVVDAGADPKCQFEDLGNALRKIEIDLGVPIVFRNGIHMKAGAHKSNLYCAMAKIHYDYVDNVPSATAGDLLYIKAGITGMEPPDVTQYARTHPTFPHESTVNQFFNESQFESYRHLGHHTLRTILHQAQRNEAGGPIKEPAKEAAAEEWAGQGSLGALFRRAKSYVARADATHPPAPSKPEEIA